jgi:hypothetical protein
VTVQAQIGSEELVPFSGVFKTPTTITYVARADTTARADFDAKFYDILEQLYRSPDLASYLTDNSNIKFYVAKVTGDSPSVISQNRTWSRAMTLDIMATSKFLPSGLSGLSLWLKADAGVTLSGFNVTAWADQSGNGRNMLSDFSTPDISFVSSVAGFNNKPVIRFSISNNNGDVGLSNSNTFTGKSFFIVYKLSSITGFDFSIPFENTLINVYTNQPDQERAFGGYYNAFYDSNTISTLGTTYLRSVLTDDGQNINYFINGDSDGGTTEGLGSITRDYIVIGNGGARGAGPNPSINQPFQGDLAEIICYNRVLNTSERKQVEAYLNTKYAIY